MQVDYNNIVKLAYPTAPTIFTDAQLEIIRDLIKYADYYDGDCFKYIIADWPEYGRQHQSRGDYNPANITVNYTKKIIDKLSSFQFEIPVDFDAHSKQAENRGDEIEIDLYKWHKKNKMDLKLLQASKEHNISGGVVFKMIPDDELKEPRIVIRGRIECFPVYEFDNYEHVNKIHFIAFINEQTIWKQTFQMINGFCYVEEAEYDARIPEQPQKVIMELQPLKANGKPLDFMPIYIVPNLPSLGEVWGYSEIKDIIPMADEVNKKYSDASDSLRFEMFAITILLNVASTSDNETLRTKPGAIWQLFGGGTAENKVNVEKLETKFQYAESLKYHIESMKSLMFEMSDVIQLEGKKLESVGNLSGVALRMLFANMISKINQKNTIWNPILEQIYLDSLKIRAAYGYSVPEDLELAVIQHVPIPLNAKEEMEIIAQKLSFNLMSIRSAMDALGVQNPEAMIKEILDEKKTVEAALDIYGSDNEGEKAK